MWKPVTERADAQPEDERRSREPEPHRRISSSHLLLFCVRLQSWSHTRLLKIYCWFPQELQRESDPQVPACSRAAPELLVATFSCSPERFSTAKRQKRAFLCGAAHLWVQRTAQGDKQDAKRRSRNNRSLEK